MKTHEISQIQLEALSISTTGETWHLARSAAIVSDTRGISENSEGGHNTILIDGRIVSNQAVSAVGAEVHIEVGVHGVVSGGFVGIVAGNPGAFVDNAGTILAAKDSGVGIFVGRDAEAHNRGFISASAGMSCSGGGTLLINEKHGVITATDACFTATSNPDTIVTIFNHGIAKVQPSDLTGFAVFFFDDSGQRVINDGRMVGKVALGRGDDTFDIRGGFLSGTISGEPGDDTLITDNASYQLLELDGEGQDTVKSTVSYTLSDNVERLVLLGHNAASGDGNAGDNHLFGNRDNNRLNGSSGADVLNGRGGNDILSGGIDATSDIFEFDTGGGHDVVADFEDAVDLIDLSEWTAIHSFQDLQDHHLHFTQQGAVISAGHDRLIIRGMTEATLTTDDFFLGPGTAISEFDAS